MKFLKRVVLVLLVCALFQSASAQDKQAQRILQHLETQSQSWNAGDIDGFMEYYWKSDSLKFVSKKGVSYGWQKVLDNYKKGYPDKETMGELTFSVKHVEKLSRKAYMVVGRWHIQRKEDEVAGYFSLIWKRINKEWRIVIDHTS